MKMLLKMKNIKKSFSGVLALKGVDFDLKAGEIHALMGENGAGKSTLMKILTGIYRPDDGEIFYSGKPCVFNSVKDSQKIGITMIHQELNLIKDLTVAQNIFLGREKTLGDIYIDDRKMEAEAQMLLNYVGTDVSPSAKIRDLTVGKQQQIEIAKAISFETQILILDEPTTALSESEAEELFRIMSELKSRGVGMIYISHRIEEIQKIADRITVMRDGEHISTQNKALLTIDEIIKMMVGSEISEVEKSIRRNNKNEPVILEVENLNVNNKIKNINFALHKGEILGFSGLMGAGRTEVARAISGADRFLSGKIIINGKTIRLKSTVDAVKNGVCYLSEDRKQYGLLLYKSVTENVALASLKSYIKNGFLSDKKMKKSAENKIRILKVKTSSMEQSVKNLSGGNQQKVIIARWLLTKSNIFIFDEPTKGIDIGAKNEIYSLLRKLADEGKSIILISSELSEITQLSDRVIVMCEGEITGELTKTEITNENIMKYAVKRGETKR